MYRLIQYHEISEHQHQGLVTQTISQQRQFGAVYNYSDICEDHVKIVISENESWIFAEIYWFIEKSLKSIGDGFF